MAMTASFLTDLMVWYIIFLFSTTLHEASHAFISAWGGDDTASRSGQVTLNPMPHIKREKVGMVVVPILSFFLNHGSWMIGWASAPFNPYWAARHPKRSFLMSLAGPLSHLIPITIAGIAIVVGARTGFFDGQSGAAMAIHRFFSIMLLLNIILLIFNLMPLPPLDGSEIWYLFIKSEESRLRWRFTANSYSLAGLLLAWYCFPYVYYPVGGAIHALIATLAGGQ